MICVGGDEAESGIKIVNWVRHEGMVMVGLGKVMDSCTDRLIGLSLVDCWLWWMRWYIQLHMDAEIDVSGFA